MATHVSEHIKAAIKDQADEIRKEIKMTSLFGVPLDMDDLDSMIVAAYFAGKYGDRLGITKEAE